MALKKAKKKLSVKEQIEARKEEAGRKDFNSRIYFISRFLGQHTSLNNDRGTEGDEYVFEENGLTLYHRLGSVTAHDGGAAFSACQATFNGVLVYNEQGSNLKGYIPGPWEKRLKGFTARAEEVRKELAKTEKAAAVAHRREEHHRIREKWGLK